MQCALILMAHASFFLVSLATSTCWGLYLRATTRNRRRWILRQSLLRLGLWPVVFSKILDTWCPNPKIVEYIIKYNIYNIYNPRLTEQMSKAYSPSCQIILWFWAVHTLCCFDDHLPHGRLGALGIRIRAHRLLACISSWLWHYDANKTCISISL